MAIDHLKTDGLQQDDFRPVLFAPEEREVKGVKSLLDVTFETNPLDKRFLVLVGCPNMCLMYIV